MNKIVLVVGLPGSGKTYYLNDIKQTNNQIKVIDDIISLDQIPLEFDGDIYISDIHFCLENTRMYAIKFISKMFPNRKIELVYFENNVDQCIINVKNRNDDRIISDTFMKHLADNYNPPNNAIKVFDGK
jgi:hypothetical protein